MSSNKPPSRDQRANPEKQSRNEYIPHYIAKRPFYHPPPDEGDYLEHQRLQNKEPDSVSTQKWYDRGRKAGPAATKYRKGACENCGAMTHKAKDCLQRPRKHGAKWTGKDIQADEVIEDVELSWDGKRDRWNGYDAREHIATVEEHVRMEVLRKQQIGEKEGEEGDAEEEGDKYAEESEMPGQTYDPSARISTRNLRIREDTAKYLLNLDLDSARYDPKTRTMVDKGATSDRAAALVEEEDFIRSSGDAQEFEKLQRTAWESQERGDKQRLHLQANPTEAELIRRRQDKEAKEKAEKKKADLLAKYGGEEYLEKKPLEVEAEEVYVEYTETGQVKGGKKATVKSKYVEDKYYGNHTSIWGSWWENFKWGYACCHSIVKKSYCTGDEGIRAAEEARKMRLGLLDEVKDEPTKQIEEAKVDIERNGEDGGKKGDTLGGLKAGGENTAEEQAGKRKLEYMLGGVTEEDMEAYQRQKRLHDDPMANFVDVA